MSVISPSVTAHTDKIKKELRKTDLSNDHTHHETNFLQHFPSMCDILCIVHKLSYVSGFIYYPPTQQILLHQLSLDPTASSWSLFGKQHDETKQPEAVFKDIVSKLLHKNFNEVYPIYSYIEESSDITHTLLYALATELEDFPPQQGHTFQWFTFKELVKLPIDEQTKHDIVVGQRVIEAAGRKERGEHTFQ